MNAPPGGYDEATLAYDATTGARLARLRYNGPQDGDDVATAVGVSPDGSKVFVTGASSGNFGLDYLTIAYSVN